MIPQEKYALTEIQYFRWPEIHHALEQEEASRLKLTGTAAILSHVASAYAARHELRHQLVAHRIHPGVSVRKAGVRVVSALVVVVLDVERGQFGVLDAERTARVVNVLAV